MDITLLNQRSDKASRAMSKKFLLITIVLLGFGLIYRLILTSSGNFIFNMDNARDALDVREMVVLGKQRLIGPTSGIEGFFNGPAWYYLLAVPFALTSGDPYAAVVLMIILWLIGGYFLLKLVSRWGMLAVFIVGSLWLSSNYVMLTTLYAFNPNPVILLSPLFIYLLKQYLKTNSLILSFGVWFLGGLFFNFEMAYGVFMPVIILGAIVLSGQKRYLRTRNFWIGGGAFLITVLPQILFEFRYHFAMTKAILKHLTENAGGRPSFNPLVHLITITQVYFTTLSATLMNWKVLTFGVLASFLVVMIKLFKTKTLGVDKAVVISLLMIVIPFLGQVILPMNVAPWHVGGAMAAAILLVGFVIYQLNLLGGSVKVITFFCSIVIVLLAFNNLEVGKNIFSKPKSDDPSSFRNEIAAIDYVYQYAKGKNFRVYIYLPSVYDYPYQYLFWWYGQSKFGYLPTDYAYLPNKPEYIKQKEKFDNGIKPTPSDLVFLIKEPDYPERRKLWENNFASLPLISSLKLGPLDIEIRKEIKR